MNLPSRTQVNKIISKEKFKKIAKLSTDSRKELDESVSRLIISNVLREDTVNISKGPLICEIDVFEILLKTQSLSDQFIKEMDSAIQKSVLYILRYDSQAQLVISYKERSVTSSKYKVLKIYRSEWKNYDDINLEIKGLNLDAVFKNFLGQVADTQINIEDNSSLKEAVEQSIDAEKLTRKIEQLQQRMRKELQPNKRFELNKNLKEITEELKKINTK